MKQHTSIKSPFQLRDWRIIHLNYTNSIFAIDPNSDVQWEFEVNKAVEYTDEQQSYTGTLRIEFSATIPQENRFMELSGVLVSLFTYDSIQNEENDHKMNQLLQLNGLTFCLGMLRNFISSQSDILGLRRRLILPSINLHNIRFDEKISIN